MLTGQSSHLAWPFHTPRSNPNLEIPCLADRFYEIYQQIEHLLCPYQSVDCSCGEFILGKELEATNIFDFALSSGLDDFFQQMRRNEQDPSATAIHDISRKTYRSITIASENDRNIMSSYQ